MGLIEDAIGYFRWTADAAYVWRRNAVVLGAERNLLRFTLAYQPAPKTIERSL